MPADDQDGGGDGDGGLLLPDPPGQLPELGREVGVAGAGGGPGALDEDVEQPHIALGGLARAAFTAGDVVARGDPGPRGQVRRGGEPGHVGADLGDDGPRGLFPTPEMVSSRSRARAKGTPASPVWFASRVSTRSSSRAIAASRWAVWSSDSPISRA